MKITSKYDLEMKNVSILKMILQNETILYETNMYKSNLISLITQVGEIKINNLILHQVLLLQSEGWLNLYQL